MTCQTLALNKLPLPERNPLSEQEFCGLVSVVLFSAMIQNKCDRSHQTRVSLGIFWDPWSWTPMSSLIFIDTLNKEGRWAAMGENFSTHFSAESL
ncbi:MAG: hypothetical protein Q8Q40_12760 [Methylococcaceae bacterium]|nr:hypothetical protein [Methylococcaceae bacterium]